MRLTLIRHGSHTFVWAVIVCLSVLAKPLNNWVNFFLNKIWNIFHHICNIFCGELVQCNDSVDSTLTVCQSTHWRLVTPYGKRDLGQNWLRQWLVACRHQAITWTNVDLPSVEFCVIHLTTILLAALKASIHEMSSKIIFSKWQLHPPGVNELIDNTGRDLLNPAI